MVVKFVLAEGQTLLKLVDVGPCLDQVSIEGYSKATTYIKNDFLRCIVFDFKNMEKIEKIYEIFIGDDRMINII